MKLIMENWRKHMLSELDVRPVMGVTDWANTTYASPAMSNQEIIKYNKSQRDLAKGEISVEFIKLVQTVAVDTLKISANLVAMIMDPTGQFSGYDFDTGELRTATDDFIDAKEAWKKEKSIFNGSMLALSSIAFIPILGAAGKLAKFKGIAGFGKGLDRAEKILEATEVAARRATDPAKVRELNVVASMLRKKIDDSRRALEELSGYVKGDPDLPGGWGISPEALETLGKLKDGSLTARMISSFSGPVFRGVKAFSWDHFVKVFPDALMGWEFSDDLRRALDSPGEWIRLTDDHHRMNASTNASGQAASFSKNKRKAENFAHQPRGTLQVLVVSKGDLAPNIDIAKTSSKNPDIFTHRLPEMESEVLMLGDEIPITEVWIRVNPAEGSGLRPRDFFSDFFEDPYTTRNMIGDP